MPLGFLLHVAFVPLLMLEYKLETGKAKRKGLKFFGYSYLALLIWNVSTTWWVYNASPGGAVFAFFANAFLMTIPLMLFYFTKRLAGSLAGYASFPFYWLAFEYIHLSWDLTWPWLTLGNGFSSLYPIVQWYEFSGHLGGSFWVLIGNLLIFFSIRDSYFNKILISLFAVWFAVPIIVSLVMYFSYQEKGNPVEIVVVQPNVDPYNEKFVANNEEKLMRKMEKMSESKLTPATAFVAWPETALPWGFFEHEAEESEILDSLYVFSSRHPHTALITGISTYVLYGKNPSPTARFEKGLGYYDAFNTAINIKKPGSCSYYHKSKLVPGVEYIPPVIKNLAIDMGGVVGGLGRQDTVSVFANPSGVKTAPVICYESIFGGYVARYIRKGASFITIITNDGWWGNTPGHKQHFDYARLRSIETRRSIARSANTGISGFIIQRGDVISKSKYNEETVMKETILANNNLTFYVKYGDYLGLGSVYFSILFIVVMISAPFIKLKQK
jgi:apolipoprotein N-acyltransferase